MKYISRFFKSKLRGETWTGDVHLGIISLEMLFQVVQMDMNSQKRVPRTDPWGMPTFTSHVEEGE